MRNVHRYRLTATGLALFCALGFLSLVPPDLLAHGVSWNLSAQKAYGFEFSFDDGTPMAFAEVKVFRPGQNEAPSQIGRADKNGWFAFIPDADGLWTIKADDGTGHLAQAQLNVAGPDGTEAAGTEAPPQDTGRAVTEATKPFKIALVISIFLNVAAVAVLCRRKKA